MVRPSKPYELGDVICPKCRTGFALDATHFASYFRTGVVACPHKRPHCVPISLWHEMVRQTRDLDLHGNALRLAGARTTVFSVQVDLNVVTEIDGTQYGIADDAEIIAIELKPEGGGNATVAHGPRRALGDRVRGARFFVLAQPLVCQQRPDSPGSCTVYATWFSQREVDGPGHHLIEAARHFRDGRYDQVVVPAHVAVESAEGKVVSSALRGTRGPHAKGTPARLTKIEEACGVPALAREVIGILGRLRDRRDELLHSGKCASQSRDDAAHHLTAAVFAVRFSQFLHDAVTTARATGKWPPTSG